MVPAFRPNDRVLTYNWGTIKKGSVIVFKNKGKIYIKRVDKIVDDNVHVFGDNKKLSSKVEPISFDRLIGRIFIKY